MPVPPPDDTGAGGEFASADELRRRFNAARFHQRAEAGAIEARVRVNRHAERWVNASDPPCTHSQFVEYFEAGRRVAGAFLYRRPDGSIGGSGRPDPKFLVSEDGRLLRLRP